MSASDDKQWDEDRERREYNERISLMRNSEYPMLEGMLRYNISFTRH
jgi:hypothetical protein